METISIREAAERLGVSHKVIRRLIQQGRVSAHKASGRHGAEWVVEADSLEAHRSTHAPLSPAGDAPLEGRVSGADNPSPRSAALSREVEGLRADKAFLQRQVETLTALLGQSMGNPPASRPGIPDESVAGQAPPTGTSPSSVPCPPAGLIGEVRAEVMAEVTAALQSSLRSIGPEEIAAFEMCSVKVLWGKPVLWRVVASDPADVAALLSGILSEEAVWDQPGGEVVFLWAMDAEGRVLWGAACGAQWFGEPFAAALRAARVERR